MQHLLEIVSERRLRFIEDVLRQERTGCKIASNLAHHNGEELLSNQIGLEYRRERNLQQEKLEVIDRPICHQTREGSIKYYCY